MRWVGIMGRLIRLTKLSNHPHYKFLLIKLSTSEKEIMRHFIIDSFDLDKNEFIYSVNRMFLDKTDKPKNWSLIMEILTVIA